MEMEKDQSEGTRFVVSMSDGRLFELRADNEKECGDWVLAFMGVIMLRRFNEREEGGKVSGDSKRGMALQLSFSVDAEIIPADRSRYPLMIALYAHNGDLGVRASKDSEQGLANAAQKMKTTLGLSSFAKLKSKLSGKGPDTTKDQGKSMWQNEDWQLCGVTEVKVRSVFVFFRGG